MTAGAGGLDAHLVVMRSEGFTLDVELAIEPGTTAALLGPNGAGKSTVVGALAGLTPLDRGHLTLDGRLLDDPDRDVFVAPEHRRLGIVFQNGLLFSHLSVLENVAFSYAGQGLRRSVARRRAQPWVDALDLAALAARRPAELSGGQAQRVAIARALAADPRMLLLDEPFAALDVDTRSRLRRLLVGHLASFDGPRLLITHDLADAVILADRIHVVENGRIVQSDTAAELRRRPATPYVAALAGTNLLAATNDRGTLRLDDGGQVLHVAEPAAEGPVLVTVHPAAVALHAEEPHGSPRNVWHTVVVGVEPLGGTVRVTLGAPVPMGVDITAASAAALDIHAGTKVWASVKATELAVAPR